MGGGGGVILQWEWNCVCLFETVQYSYVEEKSTYIKMPHLEISTNTTFPVYSLILFGRIDLFEL
jgi:hypothetical protein